MDRNSIINKVKALLSKTTENGATEAEMLSALDKASAMMDAYDITDEDVQLTKEEKVMMHADPPDLKLRECLFAGGTQAVQLLGRARVQAQDCAFGPHAALFHLRDTGGTADTLGLITAFTYTPIPEPSSLALWLLGFAAFGLALRVKRKGKQT